MNAAIRNFPLSFHHWLEPVFSAFRCFVVPDGSATFQWREGRKVRGPVLFMFSRLEDFIQQLELTVTEPIDAYKNQPSALKS
jgi:hypothetical protein